MAKYKCESNNAENTGMTDEEWHRHWYDLYQISCVGCLPQHKSIVMHYQMIPQKYIKKFMRKTNKKG